jgi:hypothetical protein
MVPVAALVALTVCCARQNTASADPASAFGSSDVAVTDKHLAPTIPSGENGFAKYTFEAYFPDGRKIYWAGSISNFGFGDGKAEIKSRVEGGAIGKRSGRDKKDQGDYKTSASPVLFQVGKHKLSGTTAAIRLEAAGKGYTFDLTFKPDVAPWRPGSGRVETAQGYFDTTFLVPKGTVTGTITVDGTAEQVTGYGYGMYDHGNLAPYDQGKRWVKIRSIDGDAILHLRQFAPPDGEPVTWLFVGHKDKTVVTSTTPKATFGSLSTDSKSSEGYKVPKALVIEASSGGNKVTVGLKGTGSYRRTDELAKLSAVERAVASKFAKPVRYNYDADFEIRATGPAAFEATGSGAEFEITHMNP